MKSVDVLKILIPNISVELAETLIQQSTSAVLDYTRRDAVIDSLNPIIVDYAVVLYNRMGTEGETARSEGGISHTFSPGFPEDIQKRMNRFILAKVVGYAPEAK